MRSKSKGGSAGTSKEPRASAIARAFAVIRVLRRSPTTLSLTSIAQSAGIAPSTAHSILAELLPQGVVQQDEDKRYGLGPGIFYAGSAYARSAPVLRATWVELVQLANELELVASVAVAWDRHHLILASHQGGQAGFEVAVGGLVPLEAGSWGKAYHAWSGEPVPAELPAFTARTATDPERFRAEVDEARARGWAEDREEFEEGVGAVTTAVTSSRGYQGLVSLIAPVAEMEERTFARTGQRLAAVASRASVALGDLGRARAVGGR